MTPTELAAKLNSIPFVVDRLLCDWAVRQNRVHRKKRIDKKWRKRYGFASRCKQMKVYQLEGVWLLCPHLFQHLVRNTAAQGATDGPRPAGGAGVLAGDNQPGA